MKPSSLGAFIGGLAAFAALLMWKVFVVTNPFVRAVLFPGYLFIKYSQGMGPFSQMVFDTVAYLLDLVIYAAIGYGIGRWLSGAPSADAEKES